MSNTETTSRQKSTRTLRANETRAKGARREPWKPPSILDAPPPPEGYTHRWIRSEVMGFDDRKNVSARTREGWELVRGEEHPDFDIPTVQDGQQLVVALGQLVVVLERLGALGLHVELLLTCPSRMLNWIKPLGPRQSYQHRHSHGLP